MRAWLRSPWSLLLSLALLGACGTDGSDFDDDGVPDPADCAPEDAAIRPGIADPPGDGIDSDCDGVDGVDRDGDGAPGNLPPGDPERDCDDADPSVHPGATEDPDDEIDQDCDGSLDIDADGDGSPAGEDCDDDDADRDRLDRD